MQILLRVIIYLPGIIKNYYRIQGKRNELEFEKEEVIEEWNCVWGLDLGRHRRKNRVKMRRQKTTGHIWWRGRKLGVWERGVANSKPLDQSGCWGCNKLKPALAHLGGKAIYNIGSSNPWMWYILHLFKPHLISLYFL